MSDLSASLHEHVFLGEGHEHAERQTWAVIWLCAAMMAAEIAGGLLFGSIALVADGLHMSTHAGALLLAALAYRYARRHATDPRFTFGTGKLGDLAGFTSAIVLAMIALLIAWEALGRLLAPVPIAFQEAIPIACLGLGVNVVSAWLLSGGHHHHHGHGHGHAHEHAETMQRVVAGDAVLLVEIHEDGVPPRFHVRREDGRTIQAVDLSIETVRPDGSRQVFDFANRDGTLASIEEIPEPHAFTACLCLGSASGSTRFEEHAHADAAAHRDNNMRAAIIHVVADAAVSVLVIVGLLLARSFGWLWMDPLAGLIGSAVIASWAYGLIRDTGGVLLDMNPDRQLTEMLRQEIETDGDRLTDLHVWRLGPGHLGAVLSVLTRTGRCPEDYRSRLRRFAALSHVTVEVRAPSGG
ncbi:CDF family Co(II)/Ni(II) efflux transporter DmeF [Rhodopila sp.]|uniref:CDF family Co(II)/Ni(II) efflux transporter DmeF n=1 Tax=Rhodopila sp. TaxID=2480087 RepID=UPI003D0BB1A6